MNEWNLDALYTSFQDKKFQEELDLLEKIKDTLLLIEARKQKRHYIK